VITLSQVGSDARVCVNTPQNSLKIITLLVVDDHHIVRQGLCALFSTVGHFRVIGEARNGREAVQMALAHLPDVILMDVTMPLLNGLEATRQILAANPAAKIVILSAHSDEQYVDALIKAGVCAFLEKQTSADVLIRAITEAAEPNTFVRSALSQRLHEAKSRSQDREGVRRDKLPRLTAREREVLQLVAEGLANKQSAAELHVSIKTIEKHRQSLMDKLNIHDTAGLTRYAIAMGMIEVTARLTIA
jgi:DNA-binding NarL/FixJ family response regulator